MIIERALTPAASEGWSDDEFRSFLASLRGHGYFSGGPDDTDRDSFVRQARRRLAPEVQRRLLTDVGAVTDVAGIARAALDVVEDEMWGKRGTWLLVTSDPWRQLTDVVTREIRASYRTSMRHGADARTLRKIEKATSHDESTTEPTATAPDDSVVEAAEDETAPRDS